MAKAKKKAATSGLLHGDLGEDRKRRLQEMAEERELSAIEIVRRLIDLAWEKAQARKAGAS